MTVPDSKRPIGVRDRVVVGYARVSLQEQAEFGAGLEAQRVAIRAEAERRGWTLATIFEDAGFSGRTVVGRRGLEAAIDSVESGAASALVVAKLDRLSRSLLDFAQLMERSRRRGWALVALDLGVDTTTPQGEMVANVMASFAQFERRLIGQRTREALAVKRSQGVRLGRPPSLPSGVRARIRALRLSGLSLSEIARSLNEARVPTAQGGRRWHHTTVRAVLSTLAGEREGAA